MLLKKAMKSFVSMIIAMALIFNVCTPVSASAINLTAGQLNQNIDALGLDLKFLQVSDSEISYIYHKEGKLYQNIDRIISPIEVETEVYEIKENNLIKSDLMRSRVEGQSLEISSQRYGKSVIPVGMLARKAYDWRYHGKYDGSNKLYNMSIGAIAMALAASFGGITGAFLAAAAYIYDKNITTVYYHVEIYKDANSPKLRPSYKHVIYYYSDAAHTKPIPGNPVISIIDSEDY